MFEKRRRTAPGLTIRPSEVRSKPLSGPSNRPSSTTRASTPPRIIQRYPRNRGRGSSTSTGDNRGSKPSSGSSKASKKGRKTADPPQALSKPIELVRIKDNIPGFPSHLPDNRCQTIYKSSWVRPEYNAQALIAPKPPGNPQHFRMTQSIARWYETSQIGLYPNSKVPRQDEDSTTVT